MIDYIAVDEKLRKDVLDAKAVRGMYEGSDHYVVLWKQVESLCLCRKEFIERK